jgi:hypothetical protein
MIMATSEQEVKAKINEMNTEYRTITGENAYLYAYAPDGGSTRYVFATSAYHFRQVRALLHMETVLDLARKGKTHDQIVYGTQRTD